MKNFRNIFIYQILFSNSFAVRLYVINKCLSDLCKVFGNFFVFDSLDKINFTIFLKNYNQFSLNRTFLNYVLKNRGMSSSFCFANVYDICLDFLIGTYNLPVLEAWSNRFYYKFRPFIENKDLAFSLYYSLLIKSKLGFYCFNEVDFLSCFLFYKNSILLKSFPFKRKLFNGWFDFVYILFLGSYFSCLFYNLVDFLFIGFLRFGLRKYY